MGTCCCRSLRKRVVAVVAAVAEFDSGGWPGLNGMEFIDMEDVERISLQHFP
jgi:hypothetical protein